MTNIKRHQLGFIGVETLLVVTLIAVVALFVPNPVSSAAGIGIRPNKTVQTDASTQTIIPLKADNETLYHADGSVALISQAVYKKQDLDIQQHVTLMEQLRHLPFVLLLLVILGAAGIPGFAWVLPKLHSVYLDLLSWKSHTHQIVMSVDAGLATLPDDESRKKFKVAMKMVQDQEVQTLVGMLQQPAMPKGV